MSEYSIQLKTSFSQKERRLAIICQRQQAAFHRPPIVSLALLVQQAMFLMSTMVTMIKMLRIGTNR